MAGFISLHRKLKENAIWTDPNYLKLWIYCLFEASHKEHDQLVGNQMVKLERGQFVTGRFSLAEDMNKGVKPKQKLNDKTWWRHLNNLEKFGMLTIKSTNKYSVVTIDKYDLYQDVFNKKGQQTDQQMSNSCPSDDQQMSTNNNGNNGNKGNKTLRSKLKFETHHMQLAKLLLKEIKKNKDSFKEPNLDDWANTFRLMMERDKREGKEIQDAILFCQSHHFWYKNILSADKLRKQYDRISLEMEDNKPKTQPKERKKSREQLEHEELVRQMQERLNQS